LRNDLIPEIAVEGIVVSKMSEVPADHRNTPALKEITVIHRAFDDKAADPKKEIGSLTEL
jgi:hypothetical protein